MNKTSIAWVKDGGGQGFTWNPVRGCSRLSEGCRNCYAERIARRFSAGRLAVRNSGAVYHFNIPFYGFATSAGWTGRVELDESTLDAPLRRKKPTVIFVNSMSDLFHEKLPDEAIDRIFAVMALCPQHKFICLTKRSKRMREWFEAHRGKSRMVECIGIGTGSVRSGCWIDPLENLILCVSVEDRTQLHRLDDLRESPAAYRMLSAEPLLGDLGAINLEGIGWVIVGVESGPGARNKDGFLTQARSLKDQCVAANVPFLLKQAWADGKLIKMPLLDGRVWDELPAVLQLTRLPSGGGLTE